MHILNFFKNHSTVNAIILNHFIEEQIRNRKKNCQFSKSIRFDKHKFTLVKDC